MNDCDLYALAVSGDLEGTRQLLDGRNSHTLFNLYFQRHQFGTQLSVLTFFSCLPPHDRVTVLQDVLKADNKNERIYEKLSMAVLKTGQKQEANQLIEQAFAQQLIDSTMHNFMLKKLAVLDATYSNSYGISTSYAEARQALAKWVGSNDEIAFRDFLSIFDIFCCLNGDEAEGQGTMQLQPTQPIQPVVFLDLEQPDAWTMRVYVHVRTDLPDDHAAIDRESAKQIAGHYGVPMFEISGIRVGITSHPYKHKRASVTLRVLAEDVNFRHIGLSPRLMNYIGTEIVSLHSDI